MRELKTNIKLKLSHVSTLEILDRQNIKDFSDLIATNCDYLTYMQGMTNIIWKTR